MLLNIIKQFIEPGTTIIRANTQKIVCMWLDVRHDLPRYGRRTPHFVVYLAEFTFRLRYLTNATVCNTSYSPRKNCTRRLPRCIGTMVFSFGTTTTATTGAFSLPTATTTAAKTGFALGGGDVPSLSLASTTASVAPTSALTQKTTAAAVGSSQGLTGFVNFAMPSASTAGTTSVASGSTAAQTAVATTTTASSGGGGTSALTFVQLEENINKWAMELEEQERVFMNQASQVNSWDRLLIANGDKIVSLNSAVERVKLEQQQLDHELDFILAQQRDLEDCLGPLEKQLLPSPATDPERERTYQLAENIDTQLKQMTEDLKEVIEHLNEANRVKDATDPMVQVGRILNAHMNSLQWLDQKTAAVAALVDEVSKLHDAHKRENERTFHLTYD